MQSNNGDISMQVRINLQQLESDIKQIEQKLSQRPIALKFKIDNQQVSTLARSIENAMPPLKLKVDAAHIARQISAASGGVGASGGLGASGAASFIGAAAVGAAVASGASLGARSMPVGGVASSPASMPSASPGGSGIFLPGGTSGLSGGGNGIGGALPPAAAAAAAGPGPTPMMTVSGPMPGRPNATHTSTYYSQDSWANATTVPFALAAGTRASYTNAAGGIGINNYGPMNRAEHYAAIAASNAKFRRSMMIGGAAFAGVMMGTMGADIDLVNGLAANNGGARGAAQLYMGHANQLSGMTFGAAKIADYFSGNRMGTATRLMAQADAQDAFSTNRLSGVMTSANNRSAVAGASMFSSGQFQAIGMTRDAEFMGLDLQHGQEVQRIRDSNSLSASEKNNQINSARQELERHKLERGAFYDLQERNFRFNQAGAQFGVGNAAAAAGFANNAARAALTGDTLGSIDASAGAARMGAIGSHNLAMLQNSGNSGMQAALRQSFSANMQGIDIQQSAQRRAYGMDLMGASFGVRSAGLALGGDFLGAALSDIEGRRDIARLGDQRMFRRTNAALNIEGEQARINETNRRLGNSLGVSAINNSTQANNLIANGQDFQASIASISGSAERDILGVKMSNMSEDEKQAQIAAIRKNASSQFAVVNRSIRESMFGGVGQAVTAFQSNMGMTGRMTPLELPGDAMNAIKNSEAGLDKTAALTSAEVTAEMARRRKFGLEQSNAAGTTSGERGLVNGNNETFKNMEGYLRDIARDIGRALVAQ